MKTSLESGRSMLLAAPLAALLLSPGTALAEPFVIATGADGDPRVSIVAPGQFMVSWVKEAEPDADEAPALHGRLFTGESGGPELSINQLPQEIYLWNDDLALLGDRVLALWTVSDGVDEPAGEAPVRGTVGEEHSGLPSQGSRERMLTTTGVPLGDEALGRGGLAAALAEDLYAVFRPISNAQGIRVGTGTIFDSADQQVGPPFEYTAFDEAFPIHWVWTQEALAMEGGLFVLWHQEADVDVRNLYGQAFSTGGKALAPARMIAEDVGSDGSDFVASAEGWLAAWSSNDGGVFVRRLSPLGAPLGAAMEVHRSGLRIGGASLASEGSGYLIAWLERELTGSVGSVWGLRLDATGTPLGSAFQLSEPGNHLHRVSATTLGDGTAVVVWGEYSARRVMGERIGTERVFADGFESGDASAWSASVP